MAHPDPPPPPNAPAASSEAAGASRAWWISGAYAVFAGLWIYFSDRILAAVVPDADRIVRLSLYKGLAFVGVTATLLLALTRRTFLAVGVEREALRAEHRRAQIHRAEVERLSRLSSALSYVNQATARFPTRQALFQRVCEILVKEGGFPAAWVGLHEPETDRVVPAAAFGDEPERVHDLEIYVDEREQGRGPSGIAFRSGRPYLSNDALADPAMEAWREFKQCNADCLPVVTQGRPHRLLGIVRRRDLQQLTTR